MKPRELTSGDLLEPGGLGLASLVLLYGIFRPPSAGVDHEVQLVLSVFFATVILWMTKPVPYVISSILCVMLLYAVGVAETFAQATAGFASTLVFFFILLLLIGKSVSKVGLDDRIAGRLVDPTSTPHSSMRRVSAAVLLLAFVIPSGIARAVTFIPVIEQTNDFYRQSATSEFRKLSYYVIGQLNSLGSMALMTGGGMAIVTAEIINAQIQPFTWVEWAVYMIPPVVVIYVTSVVIAGQFFDVSDTLQMNEVRAHDRDWPKDGREFDGTGLEEGGDDDLTARDDTNRTGEDDGHAASVDDERVGPNDAAGFDTTGTPDRVSNDTRPLTRDQRVVLLTFAVTVGFWIIGSFVGVPAIIPAMFMVVVFSLPGVRIIGVDEVRSISWGVVFLMGAMLSVIEVMNAHDATQLLVDVLVTYTILPDMGLITVMSLLVFAVVVRSVFSATAPVVVILLPLLLEFTAVFGIDPLYFSLSLVMVLGCTILLPFNYPPTLLAFEEGPLSIPEVFLLGLLMVTVAFITAMLSWLVYWPVLELAIDGIV